MTHSPFAASRSLNASAFEPAAASPHCISRWRFGRIPAAVDRLSDAFAADPDRVWTVGDAARLSDLDALSCRAVLDAFYDAGVVEWRGDAVRARVAGLHGRTRPQR